MGSCGCRRLRTRLGLGVLAQLTSHKVWQGGFDSINRGAGDPWQGQAGVRAVQKAQYSLITEDALNHNITAPII